MSLFDWFAPKKKHEALASVMPSSGLSRMESTRPFHAARSGGGTAQPANRKQERMARRELLYAVVRESMVRAAVLSSAYKFKVLSLDARGRQFLVMMDLVQGALCDMERMAEIEVMIAQSAKARYDILVSAVYWRANEHVAVGDPAVKLAQHPAPRPARPAPTEPPHSEHISRPAELHPAQGPSSDEVAAFRKALQSGMTKGEAALAQVKQPHQPPSYTLLTGFEDTEMAQGRDSQLSGTQYGELR